jgi:hypothetical protein
MASSMTPVLPAPVGADTTCGVRQQAQGVLLLVHAYMQDVAVRLHTADSPWSKSMQCERLRHSQMPGAAAGTTASCTDVRLPLPC